MKSLTTIALLLILSLTALAERPPALQIADSAYPLNILQSAGAASKSDTVSLLGGPVLGNGDFEDHGLPAWDGWYGVDYTTSTESRWHADLYNSPSGTTALWCGEPIPSCGGDDPEGGYGNSYNESMVWSAPVGDPLLPTDVTVTLTLNHDSEPGYDFLNLQYETAGGWATVAIWDGRNAVDGVIIPVEASFTFTVASADLIAGEVSLRLLAVSDGAWSDQDCLWPSAGLAQVDDLGVSGTNGLPATLDDFEGGAEGWNWQPAFPVGVGDFAKIWPELALPAFSCTSNDSPQAAFIDDGVVVPCTGGTLGVTWTYGPGGFVVNTTGGCAEYSAHLHNEIWSPPIAWTDPATGIPLSGTHKGAIFEYDAMEHLPLQAGMFAMWHVRFSSDGGVSWTQWRDWNIVYYRNSAEYSRRSEDVSSLVPDVPTHVQLALGVKELGWCWGFEAQDATPAPYYDNVSFKVYQVEGPAIRAKESHLAQDGFPANGLIDYVDLGANSIRFDMAYDLLGSNSPAILPGDSLVCDIVATRPGATISGLPRLYYSMKANPLFDPYRTFATTGSVAGEPVLNVWGIVIPDRWCFDLPDENFIYPGDVVHYFVYAEDDVGGHIMGRSLPGDLDGYGVFAGDPGYVPQQWPSSFTVRGLPSLRSAVAGDQPPMLFYNDFGGREGGNEWRTSLDNLGYVEGVDYDIYYVNAPTSGVSNGLGSRATAAQIDGYQTMLYSSGGLQSYTLNGFNQDRDKSDDLALLDAWLQTDRNMMLTGDNLARDLSVNQSAAGANFIATWLSVDYIQSDVRNLFGGVACPEIVPVPGNSLGLDVELYANGACPTWYTFDAVAPAGGVEVLCNWSDQIGAEAAGFLNAGAKSQVAYFPVAFANMHTPVGAAGGVLAARTLLLQSVLNGFGAASSGPPTDAGDDPPAAMSASVYPNPFNPLTTIRYSVPRAGMTSVTIYNVRGEVVRVLADGMHAAGAHSVEWLGRDARGSAVASGLYFYEIRSDIGVELGKLTLVR